jgi:SsrA-binding protein
VFAHARNHEPRRARRLLAHKQEILRLGAKVAEKGYTLVPTELYLSRGRVKVEIALARGKQQYDKRESQKKRDAQREIEAALRRR